MFTSNPLLYDKTATGRDLEPWFSKHMMAMTAEGLHAKSEIAVELARRDMQIEELQESLVESLNDLNWYKGRYD
jgi:hypothetical protein